MAATCAKMTIYLLSAAPAVTAVLVGWRCPTQKLHASWPAPCRWLAERRALTSTACRHAAGAG